jgi:hypothetical protein
MDFNSTIDLIIKDLDEARTIIDDLKNYPGVPVLQVELAKAKCKSAGEVISLLKSSKDQITEITGLSVVEKQQKRSETDAGQAPSSRPLDKNHPDSNILKETSADESIKPPAEVKEEFKKSSKKVTESPRIADKFSHLSNRFNEQMGSKKGEDDTSDIMNTKPLSSLSEAIGINDRFLFIREIFDGNKEEYNKALSRLDSAESLSDARAIILGYTGDDEGNKAVKQLLSLVKRKLLPNE